MAESGNCQADPLSAPLTLGLRGCCFRRLSICCLKWGTFVRLRVLMKLTGIDRTTSVQPPASTDQISSAQRLPRRAQDQRTAATGHVEGVGGYRAPSWNHAPGPNAADRTWPGAGPGVDRCNPDLPSRVLPGPG